MRKSLKQNTKKLIFSAFFTAVICVFSQIVLPSPVFPITLQVFGVCLCGYLLGSKFSVLCVACYILLGAMGIPVFNAFQGGAQHLFSFTGGFIFGFLPLAFCCGIFKKSQSNILKIASGTFGVLICHFIGVLQFSLISSNGIFGSFLLVDLLYLIKDILLCVSAFFIAKYINRKGII